MSPVLFILCFETYSWLITNEEANGRFHGIKVARDARIVTHFIYTNDLLIMSRARK